MTQKRQLRLGAFMRPVSIHTAAWRYPGGTPDANFNLKALISYAQTLERGKFDAFFMADHLAVLNMPMEALKRSATVTSFDPLTLLPALAQQTKHLGLIATASTTFEPAYTIARRFASLDHLSDGRAGWNLVTTSNPDAALNFGMDEQMEHAERYARAREFYDVVTGLWDSWADDAFIRDVESGIYFDPAKLHVLNHKGKYLKVRGPLNIARPIQGWPVMVQAGASDAGRQLAAETAEVVFAAGGPIEAGRAFYADVKGRAAKIGRNPDHIKILPGAFTIIGDSLDEAKEKRARLDSLVSYDSGIAALSIAVGQSMRASSIPTGRCRRFPRPTRARAAASGSWRSPSARTSRCARSPAAWAAMAGSAMMGTPKMIADQMEEWLVTEASDGFNVMFPYLPGGLDDFVNKVVPELQRRGLFRTEYEGKTLRENLGLPRPENRFFSATAKAAE